VKPATEVLAQMEINARAAPQLAHTMVSGRLRLDVEYLPDLQRVSWRVNGRTVSRAMASRELEKARAKPLKIADSK
jgi:hypothetical protein